MYNNSTVAVYVRCIMHSAVCLPTPFAIAQVASCGGHGNWGDESMKTVVIMCYAFSWRELTCHLHVNIHDCHGWLLIILELRIGRRDDCPPKGKAASSPCRSPPKGKAASSPCRSPPKGKAASSPCRSPPKGKAASSPCRRGDLLHAYR